MKPSCYHFNLFKQNVKLANCSKLVWNKRSELTKLFICSILLCNMENIGPWLELGYGHIPLPTSIIGCLACLKEGLPHGVAGNCFSDCSNNSFYLETFDNALFDLTLGNFWFVGCNFLWLIVLAILQITLNVSQIVSRYPTQTSLMYKVYECFD